MYAVINTIGIRNASVAINVLVNLQFTTPMVLIIAPKPNHSKCTKTTTVGSITVQKQVHLKMNHAGVFQSRPPEGARM